MGLPLATLWRMTPRQLDGWLHFAGRHKKREAADALQVAAMGARGDPRALKKQIRQLAGD